MVVLFQLKCRSLTPAARVKNLSSGVAEKTETAGFEEGCGVIDVSLVVTVARLALN